jgi:hypothetical protein
MLQKNILIPSSSQSKEPGRSEQAAGFAGFLLGLVFDPDNSGDMFFRNVRRLPDYMVLHFR